MSADQDEFGRVIKATDRALWAAYASSTTIDEGVTRAGIIFPRRRDNSIRVSEQEARFIFTGELARSLLRFSVETPTSLPYQITGASRVSGQTDVTVYSPTGEGLWNIEFKAKGFSESRIGKVPIQKDIEQLLCEPLPAFWYHTLEGIGRSTLDTIWQAFLSDVSEVVIRLSAARPIKKTLVFHVCILRERFSVERTLSIDSAEQDFGINGAIRIPFCSGEDEQSKSLNAENGWICRRPGLN